MAHRRRGKRALAPDLLDVQREEWCPDAMSARRVSSRFPQLPLDSLVLDEAAGEPLYRQLYLQLRSLILEGSLSGGFRLPSTRKLATEHGISRNTVVAAYDQLEAEGLIEPRRGSQTCVRSQPEPPRSETAPMFDDFLSRRGALMLAETLRYVSQDDPQFGLLVPGAPDIRRFPFAKWRRLLNNRLLARKEDVFGYHDYGGYPPLRAAITRYLAASRGIRCEPDQIVVTTGAQAALDLLARLLVDPGDVVWMEDPSYPAAQAVFMAAGAVLQPLPVSPTGWDIRNPPRDRFRAAYVTPSCHCPYGTTMPFEQRDQLIALAHERNAWIIEDDFDAEYHLTRNTIPAMQAISADSRTIYVGTFSKTMFPSLRIGFMVMPPTIQRSISRATFLSSQYPSILLQAVLADFLDEGYFSTHLAEMRRLYRQRRGDFLRLGRRYLSEWLEPMESASGIQSLWFFRDQTMDDHEVVARMRANGLRGVPLSMHFRHIAPLRGLVLGFAGQDSNRAERALIRLRAILETCGPDCRVRGGGTPGAPTDDMTPGL